MRTSGAGSRFLNQETRLIANAFTASIAKNMARRLIARRRDDSIAGEEAACSADLGDAPEIISTRQPAGLAPIISAKAYRGRVVVKGTFTLTVQRGEVRRR